MHVCVCVSESHTLSRARGHTLTIVIGWVVGVEVLERWIPERRRTKVHELHELHLENGKLLLVRDRDALARHAARDEEEEKERLARG